MFSILMLVFGGIAAGIGALEIALFLPAVLIACALHELGHCLMARRLGYPVQSIVLHPFRGASPVQRPQNPRHEFSIAVAGPAMNLLMSALVGTSHLAFPQNSFLGRFLFFNLFLGLLNLVPAFPMDGGHALRAVLATQMPRENASRTAVRLSLGTAVLFVVIGLSHAGLYWALFALFIAVGTSQEMSSTTFFAAIKDMTGAGCDADRRSDTDAFTNTGRYRKQRTAGFAALLSRDLWGRNSLAFFPAPAWKSGFGAAEAEAAVMSLSG